jgi:hypothetical protein
MALYVVIALVTKEQPIYMLYVLTTLHYHSINR